MLEVVQGRQLLLPADRTCMLLLGMPSLTLLADVQTVGNGYGDERGTGERGGLDDVNVREPGQQPPGDRRRRTRRIDAGRASTAPASTAAS